MERWYHCTIRLDREDTEVYSWILVVPLYSVSLRHSKIVHTMSESYCITNPFLQSSFKKHGLL